MIYKYFKTSCCTRLILYLSIRNKQKAYLKSFKLKSLYFITILFLKSSLTGNHSI